jgi:hypothetical protein
VREPHRIGQLEALEEAVHVQRPVDLVAEHVATDEALQVEAHEVGTQAHTVPRRFHGGFPEPATNLRDGIGQRVPGLGARRPRPQQVGERLARMRARLGGEIDQKAERLAGAERQRPTDRRHQGGLAQVFR